MGVRVTEKKIIKIDRECKENPVYISWLNTYGGREHWLFHTVQTEGLNTSLVADFEGYVDDLETARGQINDSEITGTPIMIVNALVEREDIEGLKTILNSINVEMLMNPDTWEVDGPVWQTIRPQKGSFKILDTWQIRSLIEITFDLPYINVQIQ